MKVTGDEHASEVLSLLDNTFADLQRTGDTQRRQDFWYWKYRNSPFGEAAVQTIRLDSRLAAAGCLWPIKLSWAERDFLALQACDTVVSSDFRRLGLFGKLNQARQRYAQEQQVDLIFNFPNANSLRGYLKSGWQLVGRVPWLVRVMKPAALIHDFMHGGKANSTMVPTIFHLDGPTAATLDGVAAGDANGISLERPAGYWLWRFCQHPNRQYGLVRAESGAEDFAVFTLSKKESGLIEMVVVDFIARQKSLGGLMRALVCCARQVDAAFIAIMRPQGFSMFTFHRYGFLPVRQKNLVYWPARADLPIEIGDIKNWNFRTAIHDSI